MNASGDGSGDYDAVVIPKVIEPTLSVNPKIIQYGGAFQNSKDSASLANISCVTLLLTFFALKF